MKTYAFIIMSESDYKLDDNLGVWTVRAPTRRKALQQVRLHISDAWFDGNREMLSGITITEVTVTEIPQ